MKKSIAEFIGTFTLVFIGCSSIVMMGDNIGMVGISFAFGLALIGMAYGIGPVSGCHINPAVSIGVFAAGRMSLGEAISYIIAQVAGATVAAIVVMIIAGGADGGLGQTGWSGSMMSALIFEIVATFLFVVVILGVTGKDGPAGMAGLVIGLTLVAIHLAGISVSGSSLNPARSFGPALFAGTEALAQLWLYIVAPVIGAFAAGLLFKSGLLDSDG